MCSCSLGDLKEGGFKTEVNGASSFEVRLCFSECLNVDAEDISEVGDYG